MDDVKHDSDVGKPARGRSAWPWVILAVVLTPLLALIVVAVITLGGALQAWHTVQNLFAGRLVMRTDQPAVITQVRQLNRLETVSFTIEKVIEGGQDQGNPLLNDLLGDRLLFIAHGNVIAGVDFSQLQPEDVVTQPDGSVSLRLPPARILSHNLDNGLSRVYDRRVGLFTKRGPAPGEPGAGRGGPGDRDRGLPGGYTHAGRRQRADPGARAVRNAGRETAHLSAVALGKRYGLRSAGCNFVTGRPYSELDVDEEGNNVHHT
jgi:hypothetical protein